MCLAEGVEQSMAWLLCRHPLPTHIKSNTQSVLPSNVFSGRHDAAALFIWARVENKGNGLLYCRELEGGEQTNL